MSQQYDNNMRGIISRNERKTEDKHPDIKGQCEIEGVAYWVDGWRKDRKDGSGSFYSLSFKRKEAPSEHQAKKQSGYAPDSIAKMDDDIPFADPYKGRKSYVV